MIMMYITRQHTISAAHRLFEYGGRCERLHGHNYKICLTLAAASLNELGMVLDFGDVKKLLFSALDEAWDHKTLLFSKDPLFLALEPILQDGSLCPVPFNPTAENMAAYLATTFFPELLRSAGIDAQVCVHAVTVYETDNNCATWQRSAE